MLPAIYVTGCNGEWQHTMTSIRLKQQLKHLIIHDASLNDTRVSYKITIHVSTKITAKEID